MSEHQRLHAAREIAPHAAAAVSEPRPPGELERTSFRLAEAALSAKDWLTDHLGEPQRALFDRVPAYLDGAVKTFTPAQLRPLVEDLADRGGERKTYLVSASALRRLNGHADRLGAPRDALLAFALLGMRVLLEQKADEARERRAGVADEVRALSDEAEALERRLRDRLGPGDPAVVRLGQAITVLSMLVDDLDEEQRTGEPLPKGW